MAKKIPLDIKDLRVKELNGEPCVCLSEVRLAVGFPVSKLMVLQAGVRVRSTEGPGVYVPVRDVPLLLRWVGQTILNRAKELDAQLKATKE